MRFSINGADRKHGQDVEMVLEATTMSVAQDRANEWGILISRIEPCEEQSSQKPSQLNASFAPGRHEYKVLTQKDKWFSAKFDPEALERALNAYVVQGWRVSAGDTASFPGLFSGHREEFITILERAEGGSPMLEYKVLTQKDKWYSGKFDPEKIEGALNAYSEQGWSVVLATTASFPGFMTGSRDELVVILSRPKN